MSTNHSKNENEFFISYEFAYNCFKLKHSTTSQPRDLNMIWYYIMYKGIFILFLTQTLMDVAGIVKFRQPRNDIKDISFPF